MYIQKYSLFLPILMYATNVLAIPYDRTQQTHDHLIDSSQTKPIQKRSNKQRTYSNQKQSYKCPQKLAVSTLSPEHRQKIREFHLLMASSSKIVRTFWELMVTVQNNPANAKASELAASLWNLSCLIDPRNQGWSVEKIKQARNKMWRIGKEVNQKDTLEQEFPQDLQKQETALVHIIQKYMIANETAS